MFKYADTFFRDVTLVTDNSLMPSKKKKKS